jgi:hypothetical protein
MKALTAPADPRRSLKEQARTPAAKSLPCPVTCSQCTITAGDEAITAVTSPPRPFPQALSPGAYRSSGAPGLRLESLVRGAKASAALLASSRTKASTPPPPGTSSRRCRAVSRQMNATSGICRRHRARQLSSPPSSPPRTSSASPEKACNGMDARDTGACPRRARK